MDPALKAKWVEALRSGKYLQAEGVLRDTRGDTPKFCCLGVLCDVMGATWDTGTPVLGDAILQDRDEELLARETLKAVGFDAIVEGELSTMNDSGSPFSDIADHIEANL